MISQILDRLSPVRAGKHLRRTPSSSRMRTRPQTSHSRARSGFSTLLPLPVGDAHFVRPTQTGSSGIHFEAGRHCAAKPGTGSFLMSGETRALPRN